MFALLHFRVESAIGAIEIVDVYIETGDVGIALKAGVIAGASAYFTNEIGDWFETGGGANAFKGYEKLAKATAHGIRGGITAELSGGSFSSGFGAAFAGDYIPSKLGAEGGGGIFVAAIAGGTAAEIGGGKFANGAMSAAFVSLFGSGAQRTSSSWNAQDGRAAGYANAVYGDDTGGELGNLGVNYQPTDGFGAAAYLGDDGVYYVAMRGTQPTSGSNWLANIKQALGFRSNQYEQAVNLARAVDRATGGNVVFVGHSLGGGLASAASYATGANAITFNAAGLSSRYRTGTSGNIRAHYIRGDILSMGQDFTPLPNAAGTRISHGSTNWYNGPLNGHGMGHFLSP